ncbi:MAG: nucleoside triphosphate pyrophosphohydrolase [Oscillospiraceae bacterium]|jgi:tetrapyrrole methylase family protein/MazG family protein|nr:nucleoside triphosphate pyrophosphohydrolase [Oscillospiraceae bacterium]
MHPVTLIPLGPGHPDLLTLGALAALRAAPRVILRTERHGAADFLRAQGVAFETLDALYDACADFDALCDAAARAVLDAAQGGPVCYAVADPAGDATVARLLALLPPGAPLVALPGVTPASRVLAGGLIHGSAAPALRVCDALSLPALAQDADLPLLVTEIDSPVLAAEVKVYLLERYPPDTTIFFAPPGQDAAASLLPVPLTDLDRQPCYDHTAAALVPAVDYLARQRFGLADLAHIMRVLRGPGGCPWDREQTHESLRPYLIEEAYEAVDAMDSGDPDALADELGDVLLQVVFHAQVGSEHGAFNLDDVTSAVCRKMITRHEHIFGQAHCATAEDVLANWEKIKQRERGQQTQGQAMAAVPAYLPALMRAAKVQKKAANVGFDWADASDALDKVLEEAAELRADLDAGRGAQEEGGDLLFAAVNALRLAGAQPELALAAATQKFIARFTRMEEAILADGKDMRAMSLAQMDAYWVQVKADFEKNVILAEKK